MIYEMTDAFSDAFSIFKLIDIKKDTKPIIVTSNVEAIESYRKLYLKYFYSDYFVNAKIKTKPQHFFEDTITIVGNPVFKMKGLFRSTAKVPSIFREKKYQFAYSLASCANTEKGMDQSMMNYMNNLLKQGEDLGDSRNFKSFEDMEDKFLKLCGSNYYIGSEVSWAIFCTFFEIECMQLFQLWPYKSVKKVSMNNLTFSADPHMIMGDIAT